MDSRALNTVVEEQLGRSTSVLFSKNSDYNPNVDKLRNFKTAADLQQTTTKAALAGMMSKHTVSVYDMCHADKIFTRAEWDEKITDSINYLLLLRAVVEEEHVDMEAGASQAPSGEKLDLEDLRVS